MEKWKRLGKGAKKNPEKMWSFAKPPPGPPPSLAFFQKKNLPPFFLLKIASLMAETNFTLGPTSKTNKFHLLFLVIVGQNSQHKRAKSDTFKVVFKARYIFKQLQTKCKTWQKCHFWAGGNHVKRKYFSDNK